MFSSLCTLMRPIAIIITNLSSYKRKEILSLHEFIEKLKYLKLNILIIGHAFLGEAIDRSTEDIFDITVFNCL